jgi:hypothetical protein
MHSHQLQIACYAPWTKEQIIEMNEMAATSLSRTDGFGNGYKKFSKLKKTDSSVFFYNDYSSNTLLIRSILPQQIPTSAHRTRDRRNRPAILQTEFPVVNIMTHRNRHSAVFFVFLPLIPLKLQ